jgi:hypothetical protein
LSSGLFHLTLVLTAVVITLVIVRHAGLLHLPRRVAGFLPDITRHAPLLRLLGRTGETENSIRRMKERTGMTDNDLFIATPREESPERQGLAKE